MDSVRYSCFLSCEQCLVGWAVTDVSKDCSAFTFIVMESSVHIVTFQSTWIFSNTCCRNIISGVMVVLLNKLGLKQKLHRLISKLNLTSELTVLSPLLYKVHFCDNAFMVDCHLSFCSLLCSFFLLYFQFLSYISASLLPFFPPFQSTKGRPCLFTFIVWISPVSNF